MHSFTRLHIDIAKLDALRATMQLWLIEVLALVVKLIGRGPLARALKAELCAAIGEITQDVKRLIVLYAFAQHKLRPIRKQTSYGNWRRSRSSGLRRATQAAFRGVQTGTLQQRIAHLRALLKQPARAIAVVRRRLARGLIGRRFITVTPRALTMIAPRQAPVCAAADTS